MLCRYSTRFVQFGLRQERLISRSIVCKKFYLSFLHSLLLSCKSLTLCYSTRCLRMVVWPLQSICTVKSAATHWDHLLQYVSCRPLRCALVNNNHMKKGVTHTEKAKVFYCVAASASGNFTGVWNCCVPVPRPLCSLSPGFCVLTIPNTTVDSGSKPQVSDGTGKCIVW